MMPRFDTVVLNGSHILYERDFIVTVRGDGTLASVTVWPWKGVQIAFRYSRYGETTFARVETVLGAVSFHRQMPKIPLPPPGATGPLESRKDPAGVTSLSPPTKPGAIEEGGVRPC